jgi:16S rRNA processing protein RimM
LTAEGLVIGKVLRAHGLLGEVKVLVTTDIPGRFRPGLKVRIDPPGGAFAVERCRGSGRTAIVKVRGVGDREDASRLVGGEIRAFGRPPLPEGEYFVADLVGCRVLGEDGTELGVLAEVLATPAHDVYVVRRGEGEEMTLPGIAPFVREVDLAGRAIRVRPPEGTGWRKRR